MWLKQSLRYTIQGTVYRKTYSLFYSPPIYRRTDLTRLSIIKEQSKLNFLVRCVFYDYWEMEKVVFI